MLLKLELSAANGPGIWFLLFAVVAARARSTGMASLGATRLLPPVRHSVQAAGSSFLTLAAPSLGVDGQYRCIVN